MFFFNLLLAQQVQQQQQAQQQQQQVNTLKIKNCETCGAPLPQDTNKKRAVMKVSEKRTKFIFD